jgi:hypothetical protein
MALVLLGDTATSVAEGMEEVLSRIVASKDGLRSGTGTIVAPPGWITLTDSDTGDPIYIQTAHIRSVSED